MKRNIMIGQWLLAIAIMVCALVHAFYYRTYSIDDSAITWRFAENFAKGFGLAFNRVGPPSEGYTNFLWTMLHVPVFPLGIDPMIYGKVLGGLSLVLLMTAIFVLGRGIFSCSWLALLPLMLLAANPTVALWTMAGLEPIMFAGLLALGVCTFYYAEVHKRTSLYCWSAVSFALLLLTRPDAVLFFGVQVFLLMLLIWRKGLQKGYMLCLSIPAVVYLVYTGWRYSYFHELLPNTYYVKGVGGDFATLLGRENFVKLLSLDFNWLYLYTGMGVAGVYVVGIVMKTFLFNRRGFAGLLSPVSWTIFYLFVTLALYLKYIGGVAWDWQVGAGRFYMHIIALIYFLVAFGADLLQGFIRQIPINASRHSIIGKGRYWLRDFNVIVIALPLSITALYNTILGFDYYSSYRTVAGVIAAVQAPLAKHMTQHSLPGDVVIGQDMGFATYYAKELVFIDSIGICDRHVAKELYAVGYNYYIRYLMWSDPNLIVKINEMDTRIKNYLKEFNAKWLVFSAIIPSNRGKDAAASLTSINAGQYDHFFDPYIIANTYFHNLYADPQVQAGYRADAAWSWNSEAYYVLFKRIDPPQATP